MEEFLYAYKDTKASAELPLSCVVYDKKSVPAAFCFGVKDGSHAIIKTFAVTKDYQGQSLGKALFGWLYLQSKNNGVENIIFSTMRSDNEKIIKMTQGQSLYRYYRAYSKKI